MSQLSSGSITDPYRLNNAGLPNINYYKLDAKVLVNPRIDPGERTCVMVTVGQSLITNNVAGSYACGTKVHNLCLDNGGVYQAVQPLLGCSISGGEVRPSNYAMHLADKLIAAGHYDRVIIAPIGIGGTTVAQWEQGGVCNHRIGVLANRLAAQGYVPDMILWHQGESDHGITPSTYTRRLRSVIDTFRANGLSAPFLVAQASWNLGVTDANVRAGQAGAVKGAGIFSGPNFDTLDNTYRDDTTHFNQLGAEAASSMWLSSIEAALGF
jgi:lysophospholipase L1-like esterase